MTDSITVQTPPFPNAANMEQLRDYCIWHCDHGRGKYFPEVREHYFVIPPAGDTHDDREGVVFLRGVY